MHLRSAVLTFIEKCQRGGDFASLLKEMTELAALFGLDQFAITGTWQVGIDQRAPMLVATNFDEAILAGYYDFALDHVDPIWRIAQTTPHPFRWSDIIPDPDGPTDSRVTSYYDRIGILDGIVVPVFNERFERSLVVLTARTSLDVSDDDLALLGLAMIVFRRSSPARCLDLSERQRTQSLTPREREVLRWTAAGKSAWEVSTILRLSEKTVARHLLNIRGKLRATNTVHAVAQAIRTRQIEI